MRYISWDWSNGTIAFFRELEILPEGGPMPKPIQRGLLSSISRIYLGSLRIWASSEAVRMIAGENPPAIAAANLSKAFSRLPVIS